MDGHCIHDAFAIEDYVVRYRKPYDSPKLKLLMKVAFSRLALSTLDAAVEVSDTKIGIELVFEFRDFTTFQNFFWFLGCN